MPSRVPVLLKELWRTRYHSLIPFFWVTTGLVFINDNLFELSNVTGRSMAPTLSPSYDETGRSDVIIWRKWFAHSEIRRGDIVQFMNPLKPEALAVKRVVALEGDVVMLDRKRRPSVREGPEQAAMRAWDAWHGKVKVPEGHIWVEGDNLRASNDSNWYGPISKSLVTGTAPAIVWPPSRFLTEPWVGVESRTKVLEGRVEKEWTDGLPVELAEITEPHLR